MNSTSFLNDQLVNVFEKFRESIIKYEFKPTRNSHLIEISPLELFESDEYIDAEIELIENFRKFFPFEDLVFVSENSLNRVTNPQFIIKQKNLSLCFKNDKLVTEPIFNNPPQLYISKVGEDFASAA